MPTKQSSVEIIKSSQCCGCAACMDKCPVNAIQMICTADGNRMPSVDKAICINCGLCSRVCPNLCVSEIGNKTLHTYIGYGLNKKITNNSSSGGIFASIAEYVINKGGVVYGAAMICNDNILECRHIRVTCMDELYRLQGSKYVQSKTDGIFKKVQDDLNNGINVLFSGTSCQIKSLKRFVGENEKLITCDLVCHGVPKEPLYREYINYLEKSKKIKIRNLVFRFKSKFVLALETENEIGLCSSFFIDSKRSAYYKLFLSRVGYRDSCYQCNYATLDKPADITLGDFKPKKEEVLHYKLNSSETYSSVISHNVKGDTILKAIANYATLIEVTKEEMISHHTNLKRPSVPTSEGIKLLNVYKRFGYKGLQFSVSAKYLLRYILRGLSIRKILNL